VVGVPVALPGCVWRPPQAQGVRLGVQRRPLDAMEDEAGAILKLPLLYKTKQNNNEKWRFDNS